MIRTGREVSRIEGFSDAVFGFALTLLVVSLEVPMSFNGLKVILTDSCRSGSRSRSSAGSGTNTMRSSAASTPKIR